MLKDDWNHSMDILKNFGMKYAKNIGLQFSRYQDKFKMVNIADQFIRLYPFFYDENVQRQLQNQTQNVGSGYSVYSYNQDIKSLITQQYYYNLFLSRERLRALNLQMTFQVNERRCDENNRVHWNFDGKNVSAEVNKEMHVTKNYYQNGRKVYKRTYMAGLKVLIVEAAHEEQGTYICPNCGAEQTLEQIMTGCTFCKSKFTIEDYKDKVVSMEFDHILNDQENIFLAALVDNRTKFNFNMSVNGYTGYNMVQNYDQYFSKAEFKANVENKIAYIHYASHPNQLAPFGLLYLGGLVGRYLNVVNCNVERVEISGFTVDAYNQVIYTDVLVALERIIDQKIRPSYEWLQVVMVKDKNNKTQTNSDAMMYKCPNCGSNVDLLHGGVCEYCGTGLNLVKHDWVFGDYKIVTES